MTSRHERVGLPNPFEIRLFGEYRPQAASRDRLRVTDRYSFPCFSKAHTLDNSSFSSLELSDLSLKDLS